MDFLKKNKKIIFYTALFSLLMFVTVDFFKGHVSKSEYDKINSMYSNVVGDLRLMRDRDGYEIAKRDAIIGLSEGSMSKIADLNDEIALLKLEVKKYKGSVRSASVIKTVSKSDAVTKTVVEYIKDSCNPTYKTSWSNEWDSGTVVATKDSIKHDYKIKNTFSVIVGDEKEGFWKPRKTVLTVKSLNPNTSTEKSQVFVVEKKEKKIGVGLVVGYGVSIDNISHLNPIIGIGISYSILRF